MLQHRMQVKPCTGRADRVSVPRNATPKIQPRSERYWGRERQRHSVPLPWETCRGPSGHFALSGRLEEGNDDRPRPLQGSDLPVVAMKPVKAGGAKEEMD